MSAAQAARVPRKDARSEAPDYVDGSYFRLEHSLVDDLAWITEGGCEHHLLLKLLSMANQRAAYLATHNRPYTGCTAGTTAQALAGPEDCRRWDVRTFQRALKRLSDVKAIEIIPRTAAAKSLPRSWGFTGELLDRREAAQEREAFVIRVNRENFAGLAEAARSRSQMELDLEPDPEDEAEEQVASGRRRVIRLTPKPVTLTPGAKPERIELDEEARDAMALVERIEPKFQATMPITIAFTLRENVLQYSIADPPPAEENKRTKGESRPTPMSFEPRGNTLDGKGSHVAESRYPLFFESVIQKFPTTDYSLIQKITVACESEAAAANLPPAWLTDDLLVRALHTPGVTIRAQRTANLYLYRKDGDGNLAPGTLVQLIRNLARGESRAGHPPPRGKTWAEQLDEAFGKES